MVRPVKLGSEPSGFIKGEQIRSDGTTIVSAEWRRPIPFELLAESLVDEDLQVRMTESAGVFTYRVVPRVDNGGAVHPRGLCCRLCFVHLLSESQSLRDGSVYCDHLLEKRSPLSVSSRRGLI